MVNRKKIAPTLKGGIASAQNAREEFLAMQKRISDKEKGGELYGMALATEEKMELWLAFLRGENDIISGPQLVEIANTISSENNVELAALNELARLTNDFRGKISQFKLVDMAA